MKKKLVVLSGSGISAESGIQTFRGGQGLWDNVPIEDICTPQGWYRNPAKVLEFYNERRAQLANVQPNEAHLILARMQDDYDISIITQNVDDLHERAGSHDIIHLHGELTKVRPVDCCTDADGFSEKYVQDIGYSPIKLGDKGGPRNTQLRPHIVFFTEPVPNIAKAAETVGQADIFLIVGTSLQVYPAAGLHTYAGHSCPIYLVDPSDAPSSGLRNITHIKKVATEGMREFREKIR